MTREECPNTKAIFTAIHHEADLEQAIGKCLSCGCGVIIDESYVFEKYQRMIVGGRLKKYAVYHRQDNYHERPPAA